MPGQPTIPLRAAMRFDKLTPIHDQFDSLGERVWLNTAHQGALPKVAAEAAQEAVDWKQKPWDLTLERFTNVPEYLRLRIALLLDVPGDEIVLANSSSYGIHLLANGYPWGAGDEALVVRGDFPSTYLPFLGLRNRGVVVRFLKPRGPVVTPDEVKENLNPRTRMLCTTWVHSFNGHTVDARAIGKICRAHGVRFVLNASQGIGARLLEPAVADAVTCVGFKWLCGPYGTGFCWIRSELLDMLEYNQLYWLAYQTAGDLVDKSEPDLSRDLFARRYDLFGTANFINFTSWSASLDLILELGIVEVEERNQMLVERLIRGVDRERYELLSPSEREQRSSLVVVSHRVMERNHAIHDHLRKNGIDCALRHGQLRFSPHFYNTHADIDRALEILDEIG